MVNLHYAGELTYDGLFSHVSDKVLSVLNTGDISMCPLTHLIQGHMMINLFYKTNRISIKWFNDQHHYFLNGIKLSIKKQEYRICLNFNLQICQIH